MPPQQPQLPLQLQPPLLMPPQQPQLPLQLQPPLLMPPQLGQADHLIEILRVLTQQRALPAQAPAPATAVMTLTEEGEKRRGWATQRERLLGPWEAPRLEPSLKIFTMQILAGSLSLSAAEAARWKTIQQVHAHWIDFISSGSTQLPAGCPTACQHDFRVVLAELAALLLSQERSRLGLVQGHLGGLCLALSCPPFLLETERLEAIKHSVGTSPVSLILGSAGGTPAGGALHPPTRYDQAGGLQQLHAVGDGRDRQRPRGESHPQRCDFCGNLGHTAQECRKKAAWHRTQGGSAPASSRPPGGQGQAPNAAPTPPAGGPPPYLGAPPAGTPP